MIDTNLLLKFSNACSIPIQLYEEDRMLFSCFEQQFTPNPAYFFMSPYIQQSHAICFIISPDYLLCGFIRIENTKQYLIVGPACLYEMSSQQVKKLLSIMHLPQSKLESLYRFCHYLPRVNAAAFRNTLDFLNTLFNPNSMESPIQVSYQTPHMRLPVIPSTTPDLHISTISEEKLLQLIQHGRLQELSNYFDALVENFDNFIPKLAPDAIRSIKNTFIASAAIISRVAIRGGLSDDTAISLSDYYISKVERLQLYTDIIELLRTMMLDFTRRVSLYTKPKSDSSIVTSVYRDVQNHLYEKISTRDIAGRLALEQTYLSHLFKEKTGDTLTSYIQKQKINEARYLLETSDLPLVFISERLAYSSQQKFQAVFKKTTGITPREYRLLYEH